MKAARIKRVSTADGASAELSLLGDMSERRLARAFGQAQSFALLPGQNCTLPQDVEAVLIQGQIGTLLGSASLTRMRQQLERGASAVVPSPIHEYAEALERPIYSLRDFERLEQRILAGEEALDGTVPSEARQTSTEQVTRPRNTRATTELSHLPVSLLSRAAFDRVRTRVSLDEILDNPALLRDINERTERAGIYFEFSNYYGEVRRDVLPYLPKHPNRLLEIGCAQGHTGAYLKSELGCHVTGIELHPEIAKQAAERLDQVLVGNFETMGVPGKFDAIVATDVLEHFHWPERALRKIHGLLSPGGTAVLATPNVGHYSIVQDLLAGRWDYIPAGLLCCTHFRFFTRRTLEDALERAGVHKFRIVSRTGERPDWVEQLPGSLTVDRESLSSHGFYVILDGGD